MATFGMICTVVGAATLTKWIMWVIDKAEKGGRKHG